jgi:hypothetical protein
LCAPAGKARDLPTGTLVNRSIWETLRRSDATIAGRAPPRARTFFEQATELRTARFFVIRKTVAVGDTASMVSVAVLLCCDCRVRAACKHHQGETGMDNHSAHLNPPVLGTAAPDQRRPRLALTRYTTDACKGIYGRSSRYPCKPRAGPPAPGEAPIGGARKRVDPRSLAAQQPFHCTERRLRASALAR